MSVTLSKRPMSKIMSNIFYVKKCRHCPLICPLLLDSGGCLTKLCICEHLGKADILTHTFLLFFSNYTYFVE